MTDRSTAEIIVWDPLVRLFHWTLVIAFVLAYCTQSEWFEEIRDRLLSEEWLQTLHVWAGYTLAGLLLFRLLWGFVGPRYARFSDFVYGPREVLIYVKSVLTLRAPRHLGHNPAGGMMIIVLLLSLTITVAAGLMLYGADKGLGPLAGLLANSSDGAIDTFKELHEFFANFTVILVVGHLIGVVWESLLHRENLARAMITGRKRA
ncbi:MAG: cytochrome b/b6 domain-containing protein [Candidatus Competibacteraceae bacterium]|uniref:Cytochrome B561 n=1 Tax=Candidatus Contendobacter odensis Run_B_J11 TaxID=1400861 RepID=A0A7U7J2Z1_9GAMM|nr:cytochrome b/b6 domain-containing protein [Candidatus Contendobacter odensis]MBK8535569.1 cytochrome b/b6 domain-containing protein [Candidatus Competibacteraceae bacterium]CDH43992.1 Cytochrome B561 [Candidatus Contendobacter odensis Run_B_J11]